MMFKNANKLNVKKWEHPILLQLYTYVIHNMKETPRKKYYIKRITIKQFQRIRCVNW